MISCCRQDTSETVDLLLAHGGDMNMHSITTSTESAIMPPLHIGAWCGKTDVAQALINAGMWMIDR